MSNEQPITAAELMARLSNDTDHRRREEEKSRIRQERQQAMDRLLAPHLQQLRNLGLPVESLQELVEEHNPLPEEAVSILLSSLETLSEPRLLEGVVRALGASRKPFDGRPLTRCFESTDDEALKWAIANTIALAHPHSIDQWLSTLRESPYWDRTLRNLGLDA